MVLACEVAATLIRAGGGSTRPTHVRKVLTLRYCSIFALFFHVLRGWLYDICTLQHGWAELHFSEPDGRCEWLSEWGKLRDRRKPY